MGEEEEGQGREPAARPGDKNGRGTGTELGGILQGRGPGWSRPCPSWGAPGGLLQCGSGPGWGGPAGGPGAAPVSPGHVLLQHLGVAHMVSSSCLGLVPLLSAPEPAEPAAGGRVMLPGLWSSLPASCPHEAPCGSRHCHVGWGQGRGSPRHPGCGGCCSRNKWKWGEEGGTQEVGGPARPPRPQSQARGALGLGPAGSSPVRGQTQRDLSTCVWGLRSLSAGLWVFSSGRRSKSRHGQLLLFFWV